MMHGRCKRVLLAAAGVFVFIPPTAHGQSGAGPVSAASDSTIASQPPATDAADPGRRLVLVGLEFGAIDVDIPHPEHRGETFGTCFRLGLQAGYEPTTWLGLDAEVGFSFLGESDSLNAILAGQGREQGAAYTLVDCGIGVVGRWALGSGRWAPFVRASGGIASLALSWPDGGTRETDPSWSAGGGVEFTLARPVVLRLQGRWLGQRDDEGTTHNHATAELAVFYALHRGRFTIPATEPLHP